MSSARAHAPARHLRLMGAVLGGSALAVMAAFAMTVTHDAPAAGATPSPAGVTQAALSIAPSVPLIPSARPTVTATFSGKH